MFAVLLGTPGCDGATPLGARSLGVVGGRPTTAYPWVVALRPRIRFCGVPVEAFRPLCSGILVAPTVVVTAAHCVSTEIPEELELVRGGDPAAPEALALVAEVSIHPGYTPATGANDIALIRLWSPLGSGDQLATPGTAGALEHTSVTLVGYGATEQDGATGVKREGIALVEVADDTTLRILPNPGLSCHGDSGGAVVGRDASAGQPVALIRSGGVGCADFTVAVRLDAHRDLIDPFVAAAAGAAPRPMPDARSACLAGCEDDTACPLGLSCLDDGRCGIPEVGAGTLGEACDEVDVHCLRAPGPDTSCRAFVPCDTAAGGCASGGPASMATQILLAASLLMARRRRQHTRHRARGLSTILRISRVTTP